MQKSLFSHRKEPISYLTHHLRQRSQTTLLFKKAKVLSFFYKAAKENTLS